MKVTGRRTLAEIFEMERRAIESNPRCKNHGQVTNIMIVVQYADNHVHSQLPPIPVVKNMVAHVVNQVHEFERREGKIWLPPEKKIDGI